MSSNDLIGIIRGRKFTTSQAQPASAPTEVRLCILKSRFSSLDLRLYVLNFKHSKTSDLNFTPPKTNLTNIPTKKWLEHNFPFEMDFFFRGPG